MKNKLEFSAGERGVSANLAYRPILLCATGTQCQRLRMLHIQKGIYVEHPSPRTCR